MTKEARRIRALTQNFGLFLKFCVFTADNHDKIHPIKRFPLHKEYFQTLLFGWNNEPLNIVDKSRQMMVTWFFCAAHLHWAFTHEEQNVFFRSKVFKDAEDLLKKCEGIYNRIPEAIWPSMYRPKIERIKGQIWFPEVNSYIFSVASGSDVLRSQTISKMWFDEAAFQPDFLETYRSVWPATKGKGVTLTGTNPKLFSTDPHPWHQFVDDALETAEVGVNV